MGLLVYINQIFINTKLTFNRKEKLKSRKQIEHLFAKGKSLSGFPIKVLYDFTASDVPLQAGVTTSSRHFKKAVQRNRIKRLMREAYRINKTQLESVLIKQQQSMTLFFIYIGKEMPESAPLIEKMKGLIEKLHNQIIDQDSNS